jgi:hypothetical protein
MFAPSGIYETDNFVYDDGITHRVIAGRKQASSPVCRTIKTGMVKVEFGQLLRIDCANIVELNIIALLPCDINWLFAQPVSCHQWNARAVFEATALVRLDLLFDAIEPYCCGSGCLERHFHLCPQFAAKPLTAESCVHNEKTYPGRLVWVNERDNHSLRRIDTFGNEKEPVFAILGNFEVTFCVFLCPVLRVVLEIARDCSSGGDVPSLALS